MNTTKMADSIKSKFPFSMENIPRQKSFACLPLKFGCLLSGLLVILYSILALAQCTAELGALPAQLNASSILAIAYYGMVIGATIVHAVSLFLSTVMIVGVLKEESFLVRPWVIWMSIQVMMLTMMFLFCITMNMVSFNFDDASFTVYILEFMGLLIRFYMLMLVGSYYKKLEQEEGENEKLVTLINGEPWYTA